MKKRAKMSIVLAVSVLTACKNDKVDNTFPPTSEILQTTDIISTETPISTITPEVKELSDALFTEGSTVSVVKSREANAEEITQDEINELVTSALYKTNDFMNLIKNGQTVVIKPNLVQMKVDSTGELLDKEVSGVTTDWRVTYAVVKQVRALNPDGKIYIIEGSATGGTKNVMAYLNYTPEFMPEVDGFFGLEEDCGAWQDFNAPELVKVSPAGSLLHDNYYLSRMIYEADVLISVPCLKSTSGCVVTGGIKNVSLGTPPGNIYGYSSTSASKVNMVSHKMHDGELDKWIFDYFLCKPIDYVVVDGLQGFQNGPTPRNHDAIIDDRMNMRIIMAGADAVAIDTVCALVTGWDPQSVGYLNHFANHSIGNTETERILTLGEQVSGLRKDFSNKFPNLGGILIDKNNELPINDLEYSAIDMETARISFNTGEEAVKAELYINGYFIALTPITGSKVSFDLKTKGVSGLGYTVKVVIYDRFMNLSEESFILE